MIPSTGHHNDKTVQIELQPKIIHYIYKLVSHMYLIFHRLTVKV